MANSYPHTLSTSITSIVSDEPIENVPCGSCTACCKILAPYLSPEEISSGLYPLSLVMGPDGPIVTLYRKKEGGCGMFIDEKCSIYDIRPMACKQFDCRKGHHPKTNQIAKEKFGINL